MCLAWVGGLVDLNTTYRELPLGVAADVGFCLPPGIRSGQVATTIADYIERRQSDQTIKARTLEYTALRAAFPCDKVDGK